MITLAATAVSDVVAAIGNTTTITSPTMAESTVATSGLPAVITTTISTTSSSATTTVATTAGTAANTPTSSIVAANGSNRTAVAMTTRPAKIRRRHKVKEFNDLISCSLCCGYLINATTIDHCGHSYCRSCIVRHCKFSKQCPKCGKQISLSSLRNDEKLKAIVNKIVPGLYHNEIQRQVQFYTGEGKDEAVNIDPEDDYFSPVEPISLSLEYHPDSLANCKAVHIPPVRYLQCPAAVTVHHLQRLISSKFNIDLSNSRVDIEVIYDDKILPDDFSLMDVGYCYSWKRDSPMRFFYRILVRSVCNNPEQVTSSSDSNIIKQTDEKIEANCTKQEHEKSATSKTVHFKDIPKEAIKKQTTLTTMAAPVLTTIKAKKVVEPLTINDDEDDDDESIIVDNTYKRDVNKTYSILKPKNYKIDDSDSLGHNNNNNNGLSNKHKKDRHDDHQKDPVKMTIIARKTGSVETKIKIEKKNKTKHNSSSPKSADVTSSSDFKSLRSNDVRYMNDYTANNTSTSTKHHKSKSGGKDAKPVAPKCDIFVSIPQSGHRSSNSSDDSSENLSLAQLKTAGKKNNNSVVLKQSVSLDESLLSKPKATKGELPKLKITVPKKSPTIKHRKPSADELPIENVDLTTYAKHIGLKPINPPNGEKKEIKLKISPGNSPMSSVSSSSASSPPSAADSGFSFTPDIPTSSHKKRKKAKHSKEPKDSSSKKRRIHAEISSPAAEESLKLKVKITGNPKSYKAERKASSSSDEVIITSPVVTTAPPTPANTVTSNTSGNDVSAKMKEKKHPLSPKPMVNIPIANKSALEFKNSLASTLKSPVEKQTTKETKSAKDIPMPKPLMPSPVLSKPITTTLTVSTTASTVSIPPVKTQSPKLQSIQDTSLPASPPLPPSLFKTGPMALQPLTLGISKTTTPTVSQQPRFSVAKNDSNNLGINRLTPASRPLSTFAVPTSPRNLPLSPKLTPISSIASDANRQAQLKRSASLDGHPSFAKQPKIEQDKPVRKQSYAPFSNKITNSPATAATTPTGNGVRGQQRQSSTLAANGTQKLLEQTYYTSPMANTYTREIQSPKQTPITLPPSSISVTKMSDIVTGNGAHPPTGLTITPQQQTPALSQPVQQQKPALEIVRIQSNIPPIDQQKLTVTNNNTIKPTAPKTTRPLPPTIPLVKIKRSTNQTNILKSTITTVSAPVQQKAILTSMNNSLKTTQASTTTVVSVNGVGNKGDTKTGATDQETRGKAGSPKVTNVCDTTGVLDLSGKSSRSPSQDKSLSPHSPNSIQPPIIKSVIPSKVEASVNKLKQLTQLSPTSTTSPATQVSKTLSPISNTVTSSTATTQLTTKAESVSKDTPNSVPSPLSPISTTGLNSTNLQNLKLLSESATSREKIAIKNQRPLAPLPRLNEISKNRTPTNTIVRQQNASVRSIPNPSALTLRGQQVPMLTSISKTSTTAPKPTTTAANTLSTVASSVSNTSSDSQVGQKNEAKSITTPSLTVSPTNFTNSLAKPSSSVVAATSAVGSSGALKLLAKKNLHIEQLAASLNIRAAAAAGDASLLGKNTTSITSSTTSTPTTSSVAVTSSSVSTVTSSSPNSSVSSSSTTTSATSASSTPPTTVQSSTSPNSSKSSAISTTTSTPVISATTS